MTDWVAGLPDSLAGAYLDVQRIVSDRPTIGSQVLTSCGNTDVAGVRTLQPDHEGVGHGRNKVGVFSKRVLVHRWTDLLPMCKYYKVSYWPSLATAKITMPGDGGGGPVTMHDSYIVLRAMGKFEFEWKFYVQSASEAIFQARTYSHITYWVRL